MDWIREFTNASVLGDYRRGNRHRMFSKDNGRKPLLRSGSERGGMRNWPLFVFLTCLVLFFYAFYIYQAQSTELSMTKEQLDIHLRSSKDLKVELIDVKADLERLKASESTLRTDKQELSTKFEECSTALRSSKLNIEQGQVDKAKFEDSVKEKDKRITELTNSLEDFKRNLTAQTVIASTQDELIARLNQTIQVLQTEITALKENKAAQKRQDELTPIAPAIVAETKAPELKKAPTSTAAADVPLAPPVPVANNDSPMGAAAAAAPPADIAAAAVQLAQPMGPGDRVKLDEKMNEQDEAAGLHKPLVEGGDYEDKAAARAA